MTAPAVFANAAPMALRCPKCSAELTTYERSGIVIDQCRECRGIWLDRGELDRLIDLESRHGFAMAAAPVPARPTPDERRRDDDRRPDRDGAWRADTRYPGDPREPRGYRSEWGDDDDDDRRGWDRDRDRGRDGYRQPKKKSFFGELLEGFGD